jgi:DnaJ family protein C protein 9
MPRKAKSKSKPAEDASPQNGDGHEEEDLVEADPPSIDPYAVLHLSQTATADEVKSAYRKLALKHHPDKVSPENRETAHKDFQEIAFAYAILSDERRRKRYDSTGNTAESANLDDDDFNWVDFFREQSKNVVRGDMIAQVKQEYQGSEEEREDVLAAYERGEGDLDAVFEIVMCSDVLADEERFREIIDSAIASGEVEAYPQYTEEPKKGRDKRKANAKKEAEEAREYARELGLEDALFGEGDSTATTKKKKKSKKGEDDHDALAALIQQRQQARSQDFFDDLETKYGGGSSKKGKRKLPVMDEPPEEAFQKNAKKGKKAARA